MALFVVLTNFYDKEVWLWNWKKGARTSDKLWPMDQGNLVITFNKCFKKSTSVTFGLDFNQLNLDQNTLTKLMLPHYIVNPGQVEFTNTGCDRSVLILLQGDGEAYCHSAWQAGRALPRLATTRDRSGAPRLPPWPCVTPIAGPTPSGERLQDPGLSKLTQICSIVINFKYFTEGFEYPTCHSLNYWHIS